MTRKMDIARATSVVFLAVVGVAAALTAVYTRAHGVGTIGLLVAVLAAGVEIDRLRNRREGRLRWAASMGLMTMALLALALAAAAFTLSGA
jgi:multisubunit Na+/H+ antiporter MnhB subunit